MDDIKLWMSKIVGDALAATNMNFGLNKCKLHRARPLGGSYWIQSESWPGSCDQNGGELYGQARGINDKINPKIPPPT